MDGGAWWAAVHGVAKSQTWQSNFTFTFHFHALEKEMETHSSVLAWRIPGMGEPGGLPSMGSHRVGHDWSDLAAAAACIPLFIVALFIIARTWKQPICPSTDEWIKKLWYKYTMKYCLARKRNIFESVLMRWMNQEPIIQSEVSQKEKAKFCILTYTYRI